MSNSPFFIYATFPFPEMSKYGDWLHTDKNAYFLVADATDHELRDEIRKLFAQCKEKKAFLGMRPQKWHPRICFFDMDATVIREETLDVIAKSFVGDGKMNDITEQAMAGKIDFTQSLHSRLQMLAGCPLDLVRKVASEITLQPNIDRLMHYLIHRSVPCFLVSGGFTAVALPLSKRLNFSGINANEFEVDEHHLLTGKLANSTIVDERNKFDWIKMKCLELNIPVKDAMAVGDGANDRTMLGNVGLGVGFIPKDVLKDFVNVVNFTGDHGILMDFLGG